MAKYILNCNELFSSGDKMIAAFFYERGEKISEEIYMRRYEDGKPLEWEFEGFLSGDYDNCICHNIFKDNADSPDYERLLNELWVKKKIYKKIEK